MHGSAKEPVGDHVICRITLVTRRSALYFLMSETAEERICILFQNVFVRVSASWRMPAPFDWARCGFIGIAVQWMK
jgi:hypothetical protein